MGQKDELFAVRTLEEAFGMLKPYAEPFFARTETVSLLKSLGRLVSADIPASSPLPHFRKSTVDGLAVRAADTFGASESLPSLVQAEGEVHMGQAPAQEVGRGQGMLIPTGGMLPAGTDAVVMVEHLDDFDGGLYGVTKPVAPGENIIDIGEDLETGEVILERYTKIRPQEMGLLAAQGISEVPVIKRLKVGILSTGDEIVPPERKPMSAQTRDINGYTLYGQAQAAGAIVKYYGIVGDDPSEMKARLDQMLAENDMVLLSGGSSVGARDLTAQLIDELGRPGLLFHGLALRPGKPTIGGVVKDKLIFGLPGHPASAMVVFAEIIEPWLNGSWLRQEQRPLPEAALSQNLYSGSGREEFVRVRLAEREGQWIAEPVRGKSGLIRTMVLADALVHVPLEAEGLQAGEKVKIQLLR
ncbi:molybdopterin molybdotransferase MoeA [Paradesulfitobacterium aromaticivorans]